MCIQTTVPSGLLYVLISLLALNFNGAAPTLPRDTPTSIPVARQAHAELRYRTSCAPCSAAATICPAPWKWWLEQRPRAAYGEWWSWPLTLELVRNVSSGSDNFVNSCKVLCLCSYYSLSNYGQSCIRVTTWTYDLDLWRHRARRWCGSPHFIRIPSSTSNGLATLTFRPPNRVTGRPCHPMGTLRPSILDLGWDMGQTDGRTTAVNA